MYDKPFQGSAMSVTAPGELGLFQVLFNHAPLLAQLTSGQLTVRELSGEDTFYSVGGGFAEVRDNHVVILADSAERADEINLERAESAREKADEIIHARRPGEDPGEAKAALARAVTRLTIGRKHKQ